MFKTPLMQKPGSLLALSNLCTVTLYLDVKLKFNSKYTKIVLQDLSNNSHHIPFRIINICRHLALSKNTTHTAFFSNFYVTGYIEQNKIISRTSLQPAVTHILQEYFTLMCQQIV